MTEVWFYHLQSQPLERALPALVEKAVEREWRVVVQTVDDLRVKALDDLLWTYAAESFLPHGTTRDKDAMGQPIVVTHDADNPNRADLRIFVQGAEVTIDTGDAPKRAILLFDGNDEIHLESARRQWTRLKTESFDLAYWRQNEDGRWHRQL